MPLFDTFYRLRDPILIVIRPELGVDRVGNVTDLHGNPVHT